VSRCDLGATWEAGKQPTKTVHVATTSSGTPDGSETSPFLSLVAAVPAIAPGTRILLGPGDYTAGATITDKRGTAEAPIWLEGPATGTPARILGGGGPGLHLIGAQYWVIRNVTISGLTQQAGINVDDGSGAGNAHHIVLDHVTIGSVTRSCTQFSGVSEVVVRDSSLSSCDRGVMMVGVQGATIARTSFTNIDTVGVAAAGGSSNIEVRQNVLANLEDGLGVWIGGDSDLAQFRPALSAPTGNAEATNIRVFDNVIRDVKWALQCSNCTSSLVAHNLIRRVNDYVFRLHQPYTTLGAFAFAPAGGVRFINNAIELESDADAVEDTGNGTAAASCTYSHDMWQRDGGAWTPALPSIETMGLFDKQSGYDDTGRLCKSAVSLAAAAGAPVPEVTGTKQGACRGAPPSIGPGEPEDC
jgi:hypothetical protein